MSVLAGCTDTAGTLGGLSGAPRQTTLGAGDITVAGPPGFCVDTESKRDAASGGFVLMGSCAALSLSPLAPRPAVKAVLTASVSPAAPAGGSAFDPAQADQLFRSDAGRALLARSGSASDVTIVESRSTGTALLLALVDTSGGLEPGIDDAYWRAITEIRGRIVTLSVMPATEAAVAPQTGMDLAARFVAQVVAQNR
ncbi:MAG: hypothetical protein ACRCSU_10795 [Paracoccaceae bacterium]